MWQPPRQYIDDQLAVGDQKVAEMLAANIIFEVPTTARHASAVTLPMKRAYSMASLLPGAMPTVPKTPAAAA